MSARASLLLRFLLAGLFLCLCSTPAAAGEKTLYRYRDASGNLAFTDNLQSIPAPLRKDAVPFVPPQGGGPSAAPIPADPPSPAAPPPSLAPDEPSPAAASGFVALAQGLWEHPWAKIGAYLAGVVVLFLLLIKLLDHLPSPLLARLILLAFFLGVMTFGYKLYIENIVQGAVAVKDQSVKMFEKALKQRESADQAPAQ